MIPATSWYGGGARAQAWLREPGGHYAVVRAGVLDTRHEFNYQGDRQRIWAEDPARSNVRYREMFVDGYLEYGLAERLTLVGNLTFKNVRTWEDIRLIASLPPEEAIRTNYGLSDLWLLLRTPLLRRRTTLSIQSGIKVPLGYDPQPDNQGPPLGTGGLDGDFGLYAGVKVASVVYVSGGGSYRVRRGDFNDEFWMNGEIGGTWRSTFTKVRLEAVRNVEDPVDLTGRTVETPIPGDVLSQVFVGNQDITKLVISMAVGVTRELSVLGEAYHTLSGKNALDGTTFIIGLTHATR